MIAKVEATPVYKNPRTAGGFVSILSTIMNSKTESELRYKMGIIKESFSDDYHWGFGGSHMWVKQVGNDDRLIIVEF